MAVDSIFVHHLVVAVRILVDRAHMVAVLVECDAGA